MSAQAPAPGGALGGYLAALGCAALAGGTAPLLKVGLSASEPFGLAVWVLAFAAAFSAALSLARPPTRPTGRGLWGPLLAHVALCAGAVWATYAGVARLDPTVAAFLGRTEALVSIALAVLLFGERFRGRELVGGLLAVAGVLALHAPAARAGGGERLGQILVLGGAALFGAAEVLSKLALRHADPLRLVAWRNALLVALCAAVACVQGRLGLLPPRALAAAAGMGLLGPTLARMLYLRALRRIDLSKAALVNQTQPLFAALLSFAFLGTVPGPWAFAGGGLVLAGCGLLVTGRPRPGGAQARAP